MIICTEQFTKANIVGLNFAHVCEQVTTSVDGGAHQGTNVLVKMDYIAVRGALFVV